MNSYSTEETEPMDSPMPGRAVSPRKYVNRKSVIDEASVTQQYIMNNINELTALWDEVDMKESDRVQRVHTVHSYIRRLADDMYNSELQMVQNVKTTITEGLKAIKDLRQELCMNEWSSDYTFPSITLMKEVESEVKNLNDLFETRKAEQDKIIERLDVLCERLGKPHLQYLPEVTKKLLSRSELRKCSDHVDAFEKELEERLSTALSWQADLRLWHRNLKPVYGENSEEAFQVFINEDIHSDNFLLTTSILERLETFWNEYSTMHNSWKCGMDLEWATYYAELKELWDQCLYGIEERKFPSQFDPAIHSQDDIEEMADEVNNLKQIVAIREPIYKAVAHWKEAWQQKLYLEELKKDPAYYQSRERGRNISKDAQQERLLHEVKLPQLKRNVAAAYTAYLESRPEDRVLIEGYEPVPYIEWIENEYNLSRERERTAKMAQKKTVPGVFNTPQTTSKRINKVSVSKTSNVPPKKPKIAEPQISIITPIRTPSEHGPKTSSPKEFGTPITPSSTPRRPHTPRRNNFQ